MHQRPALLAALVCSFTAACEQAAPQDAPVEPRCAQGTPWAPGTSAFVERTAERGLLGVRGQRISAVDLDRDGDADLVVRRVGAAANDTGLPLEERTAWLLRNDDGTFSDLSAESGLFRARGDAVGRPGDVYAFGDVDNDGDLDAFAGVDTTGTSHGGETSEIFLNQWMETGTLAFALVDGGDVRRAGLPDIPASASFLDVDRDGVLDLFVGEHNYDGLSFVGNRLYRGHGDGSFEDVTETSGVAGGEWTTAESVNGGLGHTRTWASAACDLNNDGDPELLAASYGRAPNHLLQARGEGRYKNVSVSSGYAFDEDFTWQDNEFARCHCSEAPEEAQCEGAEPPRVQCTQDNWDEDFDTEPFRLGGNSGTTVCGDLDNDGDLDLITSEIKHWWAGSGADGADLLENVTGVDRAVRFTRPGRAALGLGIDHLGRVDWDEGIMTANLFDFDNDGRLDIYWGGSDYPGNRGMLFHHTHDALGFEEVGTDDFFEHNRSHGVAVADFDGDGDVDVVVGHSRSRCGAPNDCYDTTDVRFFENVAGQAHNWIRLALQGKAANAAAIGARVTVEVEGLVQVQEVGGGFGHYGAQNDTQLSFGLGARCGTARVTIRWPDVQLSEESFELASGWTWRLVQGERPTVLD